MIRKTLVYRLTSITNCLSLIFQLLYPGLITLAVHAEAAGVPVASVGFDGGKNSFQISVSTSQEVKYSLSYSRADGPTETINGTETQTPQFEKEIYAGTCSDGVCVPHQVKKGLLKWASGTMQGAIAFTVDQNVLSVKSTYGADKLDLTPDEEKWLNETDSSPPTSSNPAPTIQTPKECLAEGAIITTAGDWAWKSDGETGVFETKDVVKLGVKYVFPQNNNVSVTFSCLPKDESLRTSLKIQQVKSSDLKLPTDMANVGEYAYDITTGMEDGSFNYDVTLPKAVDSDAQISFIEKSVDTAKNYQIANVEVQQIEDSKTIQENSSVKATNIDHFTIYIVSSTFSGSNSPFSVLLNGGDQALINTPGASVEVTLTVGVDAAWWSSHTWKSTQWRVGGGGWTCVNTPDHDNSSWFENDYTESFNIIAQNSYSTKDVEIRIFGNDTCSGSSSDSITIDNGITVQDIATNPSLSSSCGLDIALVLDTSTSINATNLTQMKNAFKGLVDTLSGTPTQFSVTQFNATATLLQGFTSNTTLVKSKIDSVTQSNWTNWEAGLFTANSTLPNRTNPNLIIFASDGNPNSNIANGTNIGETLALSSAVTEANSIKTEGTRILALGIGSDLNVNNLKMISGSVVGSDLNADVITSNFDTLASALATFASQTCGGTITVRKTVSGMPSPTLSGWHFTVNGNDYVTDSNGYTQAIPVPAGGTYSVTEVGQAGYTLGTRSCSNGIASIGTQITDGVGSLTVNANDIVSCTFENTYGAVCGDGIVSAGEACDDGNQVNTDTCTNNCTSAVCGDGVVQSGVEACDDGNSNDTDACTNSCQVARCGDGIIQAGVEECDDANSVNNDACTNSCTLPTCGDGIINQLTEQCDNGPANSDIACVPDYNSSCTYCTASCQSESVTGPYCGDGIKNGTEECDGSDLGGLPTSDFTCSRCSLELINPKVTICHATSSHTNPYNQENPNKSADVSGHDGHDGPVWYPGIGVEWGDIIPPFYYVGGHYDGKNWTDGQSIWDAGCEVPKATLTVTKLVTNDNGGTKVVADFPLFVNGSTVSSGVAEIFDPGAYTISETGDSGYMGTIGGDCDSQGNITLVAGDVKACTITNNDIAPLLTVVKVVQNGSTGATATAADFQMKVDGTNVTQNVAVAQTIGSHTVTESGPEGYTASYSSSCPGGMISLALGDNKTCVVTNTRDVGAVKVNKRIDLNGDGDWNDSNESSNSYANSHGFSWSLDHSSKTFGTTVTGLATTISGYEHSFSENMPAGYHFVSWYNPNESGKSCSNPSGTAFPTPITITKDQTIEVTLCNARDMGVLIVHKFEDNNANQLQDPGESNLSGWDMNLYRGSNCQTGNYLRDEDTTTSGDASFGSLTTGDYSVKETLKSGWKNTTSLCQNITVVKDTTSTVNFGNYRMGSITIKKITNPGSLESFTYRGTLGTHTFYNNDSDRYNNLEIGTYTIAEDQESGWYLSDLVCDYGSVSLENRTATISLTAGINATCTFTNTKYGLIHGEKFNDLNGNDRYDLIPYEPFLNGWRIFLDENNNGVFDEGERFDITHDRYWLFGWFDLGDYRFDNLVPGDYRVCEEMQTGWFPTSGTTCYTTTIRPGDVDIIQFANRQTGSISIQKFEDMNGNGVKDTDEVGGRIENWEMGVYAGSGCTGQVIVNGAKNTDAAGVALFENLVVGNYSVKEMLEDSNWINTTGSCLNVTVNPGAVSYVDVGNFEKGEISVHKYNDMNGNGVKDEDERYLPDWTINLELSGSASSSAVTNTEGLATFAGLSAGTYLVSETNKPGWTQTNIDCGEVKNDELIALKSELDNDNNHEVIVRSGSSLSCDIGNQYNTPDLKIKKHNDRWPNSQAPGSDVHYTIVLTALENPVDHPFVRDLLPKNIKYRPGSYKVVSSLSGDLTASVAAPTYASPGTWTLPGMVAGEELTLTYTGDVDGDIKPGTYKDVAWAQGTWTSGEGDITHSLTADSVDSGYTDPGVVSSTFVGTKVLVDRNTNDNRHMDVIKEEQRGGLVLGATTELPGTGQPTLYAFLALGLLTVGGGLQVMTRKMRRKHD